MSHRGSSPRPEFPLSTAEGFAPLSRSSLSWRRDRLLRFRALLQDLEYEYSELLHTAKVSLPDEEIASTCAEPVCQEWDATVPIETTSNAAAHCLVCDEKLVISRGAEGASPEIVLQDSSPPLQDTEHRDSIMSLDFHLSTGSTSRPLGTSADFPRISSGDFKPVSTLFGDAELLKSGTTETCSRSMQAFPSWWNPDKKTLGQMLLQRASAPDVTAHESKPYCVFSPVAFPKLHWDFIGFALILYDSWATPFQMIFSSEALELNWMRSVDLAITAFFILDIILNFNTGVIAKRGISFKRNVIVQQYAQSWFWLDLVATIPYDEIYQGASLTGLLRFVKMVKFVKTLRLLRLMSTLKSLKNTENVYFQAVHELKRFTHMLGILFVLLFNVHFFCCLWLALSEKVHADTFARAMRVYFDTYAAIFFAMFNGERLDSQATSKKLLEMVISGEQFLMICFFSAYVIFQALVLHGDAAKSRRLRDQVQRYMSGHGLPIGTQIQVLSGLEEARSARALQKDFITLTSSDLPQELRQKVAFELWEGNLMKLGLFARLSELDEDFCHSMSLLCREEVFATDVVLFREQDLSIAAYCIVAGELKVSCAVIDGDIPSFKEGTWVGESSLINPLFRRGLTVVSLQLSSVMVVLSTEFQNLLKESNLWHHFQESIIPEVFHGLCGRCGSIGDHFFDSCPSLYVQWLSGLAAVKKATCPCWPSVNYADSVADQVNIRELVDFLEQFKALSLLSALQELKVYSLSQLEKLEVDSLSALLETKDSESELTKDNLADCINTYREDRTNSLLEQRLSLLTGNNKHFLFLSHYKVEAGTEAALMRSELEPIIDQVFSDFQVPIFLDSEDLTTLRELEEHVRKSFNVVLLLTRGVLSRPWVLVELVTAARCGVPVVPLQVVKPGVEFTFPSESFYDDLLRGKLLDEAGKQLLSRCDIEIREVEQTLRNVFQNIAVIYSPHRPAQVRHAELQELLRSCAVKKSAGQPTFSEILTSSTAAHSSSSTTIKGPFSQTESAPPSSYSRRSV